MATSLALNFTVGASRTISGDRAPSRPLLLGAIYLTSLLCASVGAPVHLKAQTIIFAMDGGSCTPNGTKPQINQIDASTGNVIATFGPLSSCAGEGVAAVGHYLYYTTAVSNNVYQYDLDTGTDSVSFAVSQSSQGLASIAYDGKNLYLQDVSLTSPTRNIFVYQEQSKIYVRTITLSAPFSPCQQFNQTFCDGLEYVGDPNVFNGQDILISNRGASVDPYDAYDLIGNLIAGGTGYIAASGDSGIAWDGTNFYTSAIVASQNKPQPLLDVWNSSGQFVKTLTLSGARTDANIQDLAIAHPSNWRTVANPFPGFGAREALLLTDGSVMVQEGGGCCSGSGNWWRLVPDQFGDYINGTWNSVSSMPSGYCPAAYASAVLPDGRLIVEGGEFNCVGPGETNLGAIFDPTINPPLGSWTSVMAPPGWNTIGDGSSVVLPNGTFMLGNCCTHDTNLYDALLDPNSLTWTRTGAFQDQYNSEHGWELLPPMADASTGSVMVVNCCYPIQDNRTSERYFPLLFGTWYPAGSTIVSLWDFGFGGGSGEIGPAVLRPDGTLFAEGASDNPAVAAHTAVYHTTSSDPDYATWTAGPDFPYDQNGQGLGAADAPAALLPNGNVLAATAVGFDIPTRFYELTLTNQWLPVSAPPSAQGDRTQDIQLLLLPTGQVLFLDGNRNLEIYTPSTQHFDSSWAPALCHGDCGSTVMLVSNDISNYIYGFRFNGMSQGTMFGDDAQMASNYPIIRITDGLHVYYCRSYHHSSMGVQTGNLTVGTFFDCPGVPDGFMGTLQVVANGIPSNPLDVSVGQCTGSIQNPACPISAINHEIE